MLTKNSITMGKTSAVPIPFRSLRTISCGKGGLYIIGAMFTAEYTDKAERLAASCEKFGLRYELHEVPTVHRSISNRGTGDLSYTKANFICHMLAKHKKPVLYLDADCEFLSPADLIDELVKSRCDFAIYNSCADEFTDRFLPIEASVHPGEAPIKNRFYRLSGFVGLHSHRQLLCSGLVQYYRNSLAARSLLIRWQKTISKFPNCADDHCLDFVYNNLSRRSWIAWILKASWLPKSYARISWWIYTKPVINHPERPGVGEGFQPLSDPKGRKRFYVSLMRRTNAVIFPKDCVIDTQEGMVCKLVEGRPIPIEPTGMSFWV